MLVLGELGQDGGSVLRSAKPKMRVYAACEKKNINSKLQSKNLAKLRYRSLWVDSLYEFLWIPIPRLFCI